MIFSGYVCMRYAPTEFKGVPYADIIARWFALAGGEPVQGERNDKLHRLASHLRYITDNDENILLQIMPRYGLSEEEMKGLIHSACSAKWYSMPSLLRQAVDSGKLIVDSSSTPQLSTINYQLSTKEAPPEMPKKLPKLMCTNLRWLMRCFLRSQPTCIR